MTKFRDEEGRRLANLTGNSKSCMDKLNSYRKLGEKILKTAELCRKLETEKVSSDDFRKKCFRFMNQHLKV